MGHLVGKDVYRKLGTKVDGLTVRAPWNETMRAILKELYSPDEAEVFIGMPYGFATLDRIARSTGHERVKLQGTLERLAQRGWWWTSSSRAVPNTCPIRCSSASSSSP